MSKPTPSLLSQMKAARRVSVPLVSITTPDPAATVKSIVEFLTSDPAINGPALQWDVVEGLTHLNEEGKAVRAALVGDSGDPTVGNPVGCLQLCKKLGKQSILFFHLADRILTDPMTIQATWNLRDVFKQDCRMLVLLTCGDHWPAELAGDIVTLDEPLPDADALAKIIFRVHRDASVALDHPDAIIEAVQGLPAFQAEQVVAMSLTRKGCDVPALWERKRQQIEQTAGLKVNRETTTFDDIGGVPIVKDFLKRIMRGKSRPNAVVFIDEIEKFMAGSSGSMSDSSGVSQDQLGQLLSYMQDHSAAGMIFVGPPGCLAGDTHIRYRRGKRNTGRRITLKRLFQKFNGLPVEGGRGDVTPWHKPCDTFLHSFDPQTGTVFYNRVLNVTASGVKPCVEVILSSGEKLKLTTDHLVMTPDGYLEAGQLESGVDVMCRGSLLPTKAHEKSPRRERVVVRSFKFYSGGQTDITVEPTSGKAYEYRRQFRSRLVVEADMNHLPYEEYLRQLKTNPSAMHLLTLDNDKDVHHINCDTLDDRIENLRVIDHADHPLEHSPLDRFGVEYTRVEQVVAVRDAGIHETFDIEMADPCHNFSTADGLFVHNCAKSAIAKAAGTDGGIPTIQLDLGAMKGGIVGQSEQNLRTALKVVTSVSNGRSLWIATCNSISDLPPELRRRFTLGTFFFDLPDESERRAIWKIWLQRYDLEFKQTKGAAAAWCNDVGWTGAEIRQCCDIAFRLGCTLKEAAEFVVPVSRSASEQLERLRKAAEGRFLSASRAGVYSRETEVKRSNGRRQLVVD